MIRLIGAALILCAALFVGARRIGPAPALGPFLEPAHGIWSLARSASHAKESRVSVARMHDSVTIVYDDRAVPHIFAASEEDAYRALGYVVARDRLFQLYLQTMAATGRLTEVAGARALSLDREMRGLGLPRAAEHRVAALNDSLPFVRFARAYADGVNAYIDHMPASELPLEFRLTGTRPERWSVIDSYHLFNRMGWTLAHIATETERAAAASRVGLAAADALFPDAAPIQEPIQPNGQTSPRFDLRHLPPPGNPDTSSSLLVAAAASFLPARTALDEQPSTFASNNWAVSPARSANRHALLAGDPHLDLTLPSIWYEVHLVVPGVLDVYGVTIPGAPHVVIGFNRDVAWTFTNHGVDVMDFYAERVDDAARPTRYFLDGAWQPLERRIESYRGPRGQTVAVDTMYYTHRGPMHRVKDRWLSMRWTVLEAGHELDAFFGAARAHTAQEAQDVIAQSFQAPSQNMLAADRGGHIAIRSVGRYPIRPGDGRGNAIRDGIASANDWIGAIPVAQYPQSYDPAQGYLASANQQAIDPRATQGWWGGSYDPWRALRINALLRGDSAMTPETMRRFQTDPGSERANLFVPAFLNAAKIVSAKRQLANLSVLDEAARLLAEWDRRYTKDNRRAVLFEEAMRELATRTWDELVADTASGGRRVATPDTDVLAQLLSDSASRWWDDRVTTQIEQRDDILAASLTAAMQSTRGRYGDPSGDGWRWDHVRFATINHLLRLPALSVRNIPVQGGTGTLNPFGGSGTHGPSWRMVVELGDEIRAWSTYPGGQSGNPVSPHYRDRIAQWANGELDVVRLPRNPAALTSAQRSGTLILSP